MSVLTYPTCPTDCSGLLPAVEFECRPETHWGEISKLYIAREEATDFNNVEDSGEWTARLSQDGTDPDAIRELTIIGDKPAPDKTEVKIAGNKIAYGFKTHKINVAIDDDNDTNYSLMLYLECNVKVKLWYATADGYLYGGNSGELVNFTLDEIIPGSRQEVVKLTGLISWEKKNHPYRVISPMA